MQIDLQTLKELELLSFDTGGSSIFELTDLTSTPGGQYKLKQNFRKPSSSVTEIGNTQNSVKYILRNLNEWNLPVDSKLMDLLDVYYFSKSKPIIGNNVFARFIESISYRFIYKDFKSTFIQGSRYVIHFIKEVARFRNKFKSENLPVILNDIFIQINEILDLEIIREAAECKSVKSLSDYHLLQFDKAFRDKYKDNLLQLIDLIYTIDVLISKARATHKYKLNFPEFSTGETASLSLKGLYHIFVHSPVTNDIDIEKNQNFVFLTGPNMAGKTTFLKACGVAIFLAHLGMGVPAQSMNLSLFDRIFTSLNISDNLSKGYSYFYSEVSRVKDAAYALRESNRVFVIFDELFKGTNVQDAFDGSLLIINELVKWKSSFFIISSHILELGKKIEKYPAIRFMCFDSKVENGKPSFNFKIKEGLSDERLGLIILKNEKVFQLLDPEKSL